MPWKLLLAPVILGAQGRGHPQCQPSKGGRYSKTRESPSAPHPLGSCRCKATRAYAGTDSWATPPENGFIWPQGGAPGSVFLQLQPRQPKGLCLTHPCTPQGRGAADPVELAPHGRSSAQRTFQAASLGDEEKWAVSPLRGNIPFGLHSWANGFPVLMDGARGLRGLRSRQPRGRLLPVPCPPSPAGCSPPPR